MGWHEIGAYVGLSISGLLILFLCVICICWAWHTRVDEDEILVATRKQVTKHSGRDAKMGSQALNITKFMDLHVENCKKEPFNKVTMVSATDYAAALSLPNKFSWRRALKTALVKSELKMLLPLTDLMSRPEGNVDPFAVLGGSNSAYSMMRDTLSPLHLYALGELMNLAAADVKESKLNTLTGALKLKASTPCVEKFLDGERSEMLPADMARMPEPFILDEHLPKLLEGLDPDGPVKHVEAKEGVEWLPDVSFSHVGIPYRDNEYEVKCGLVFAVLLNRLSANTMPDKWKPSAWRGRYTSVKLTAKGPAITSPGGLMRAITDDLGARVQMKVVNRVTSFGMAMKQDDKWHQVFTNKLACEFLGVVLLEGDAESSGTNEIVTLMGHSEVALRVSLPGQFAFKISWYQGMEGFTGWHGGNDMVCPWNNGPETEVVHSCWSSGAQYAAAADVTATVACVTNRMADELSLPNGGYGYLGVCNDSVATIQAALDEPVTMFPCILAGQAKTQMAQTYAEVSERMRKAGGNWDSWAAVADRVRKGLLRTPCDVIHDPTTVDTAIHRIQASLPNITPFATLEHARKDLDTALEQYTKSGLLNSTPGGGASPRYSARAGPELPIPPV